MTATTEQHYPQLRKCIQNLSKCDNILPILGRSMRFSLLFLWEDGRAGLEEVCGSKVTLRRSKEHLINEMLEERRMIIASTGIITRQLN